MKLEKLYHYSKEKYDKLKTRKAQGKENDEERQANNPDYDKHISFFFEPVPLDILGDIYKEGDNDFWFTGNKIWQYEISVKNLPEFRFEIVESPLSIHLFYDDKYKDMPDDEWNVLRDKMRKEAGEFGNSKEELIKAASPMMGLSREMYKKLPKIPNWEKVKSLYAATVPHVMLYPEDGIVEYDSVKRVVVGGKKSIAKESILDRWV